MDLKTVLASGTAAIMTAGAGFQQFRVMGLDDTLSSVVAAKEKAEGTLKQTRDGLVSDSKRQDAALVDLQARLEKAKEQLEHEKGRNTALENTIGSLAEKVCPAPRKR